MSFNRILERVGKYYGEKIRTYGPTAKGVHWNSLESQILRFDQLLKICNHPGFFSIIDYGCGYGALLDYMLQKGYRINYQGFNISSQMIENAKKAHKGVENSVFLNESFLRVSDYTIASGIFNVKLGTSGADWKKYILMTFEKIDKLSKRGFAFNALTK